MHTCVRTPELDVYPLIAFSEVLHLYPDTSTSDEGAIFQLTCSVIPIDNPPSFRPKGLQRFRFSKGRTVQHQRIRPGHLAEHQYQPGPVRRMKAIQEVEIVIESTNYLQSDSFQSWW
jgi:hypothetical protein